MRIGSILPRRDFMQRTSYSSIVARDLRGAKEKHPPEAKLHVLKATVAIVC